MKDRNIYGLYATGKTKPLVVGTRDQLKVVAGIYSMTLVNMHGFDWYRDKFESTNYLIAPAKAGDGVMTLAQAIRSGRVK